MKHKARPKSGKVVNGGPRCPDCGKVRFLNRAGARTAAKQMRSRIGRLNAYKCGEFWHLGHLPADVVAGDFSRDDINPREDCPAISSPSTDRSDRA